MWFAHQVGTLVDARWESRQRLFPGVVTAVNEDGSFAVQYNDGDFGGAVPAEDVHPRCPAVLHVPVLQRCVAWKCSMSVPSSASACL